MSIRDLLSPNTYDIHARSVTIGGVTVNPAASNQVVICSAPAASEPPPASHPPHPLVDSGVFPDTTGWEWAVGADTTDPAIAGVWVRVGDVVTCDISAKGLSARAGKPSEVCAVLRPLPHRPRWLAGYALVLGNHTDVNARVELDEEGRGVKITFDGTICCGEAAIHLSYLAD